MPAYPQEDALRRVNQDARQFPGQASRPPLFERVGVVHTEQNRACLHDSPPPDRKLYNRNPWPVQQKNSPSRFIPAPVVPHSSTVMPTDTEASKESGNRGPGSPRESLGRRLMACDAATGKANGWVNRVGGFVGLKFRRAGARPGRAGGHGEAGGGKGIVGGLRRPRSVRARVTGPRVPRPLLRWLGGAGWFPTVRGPRDRPGPVRDPDTGCPWRGQAGAPPRPRGNSSPRPGPRRLP